ncbi:MAG: putative signal peptide peptidase SppA [Chlamydiae bacterium]|nr:putative signal peptide peptidase SppA [Chlamydiota bacterium]
MKTSIFRSSLGSLCRAFSAVIGVGFGIILVTVIFAALVNLTDQDLEVKSHFSPTVIPNASDVRKTLSTSAPVILKINVGGIIGTDKLNMHTIQQQLTESREGVFKNDRVKAILVHINTPGGTVVDADGIYQALKEYKEQHNVPVFAYVDGLCASGGMYVAAAADRVYASNISLIGSIGVLSPSFFNVTNLMEKIGVEAKTLYAGKGKDDLNPFRPWRSGEEDAFVAIIDYYYKQFVDLVVSNRPKVDKAKLIEEYGAHIFPAGKALDYGFIDHTDYSLNDTIKQVAKEIGIEDDYYQVVKLDRKISLADVFKDDSPMMAGTMRHQIDLSPELDPKLMNQFLYLYLPGRQN